MAAIRASLSQWYELDLWEVKGQGDGEGEECASAAGAPVDQAAEDGDQGRANSEDDTAGAEGNVERHDFSPR